MEFIYQASKQRHWWFHWLVVIVIPPNCMVSLTSMFNKAEFSFYKDTLGILPEKRVHLSIKDEETQVVHWPYTLPEARKNTVKLQLQCLGNKLIIILIAEPTDCVSQLSIVEKRSGICISFDHQPLNKVFKYEHYRLLVSHDVQP